MLAWLETFVTLQSESVWIVESCVESRSPHHHQAGLGQFYHFLNIFQIQKFRPCSGSTDCWSLLIDLSFYHNDLDFKVGLS